MNAPSDLRNIKNPGHEDQRQYLLYHVHSFDALAVFASE